MRFPEASRAGYTGSAVTRQLLDGKPPDCQLGAVERRFGVVGCRMDGGVVHSAMRGGAWMDRTPGHQQSGAIGVLVDHVLGGAFYMARSPGQWSLTTELSIDILVPPPWRTE